MDENQLIVPEGKVVDFIDGTFRNDTPEEYVRQQIEKSLVKEYSYPKELFLMEHSIKIGSGRKRADIIIFSESGQSKQEEIALIIECKHAKTPPNNKKEGVEQLKSYMAACINSEYGLWTNGKDRFCFRKVVKDSKLVFDEIVDIPKYGQSIDDAERPDLRDLREATGDNLKFTFKRCHDYISGNQGLHKSEAFWELLKLIFCKIFDERSGEINFYVTSEERKSLNGQLKLQKRIDAIFTEVLKIAEYKGIFKVNEKVELEPRVTAFIVSQLQNYSLLESPIDVKGAAYEEVVGANLRGDRGEFFTPRNICEMAVAMINPKITEKTLDPACGTGGFITIAMNHVIEQIKSDVKKRWRDPLNPTENERLMLFQEIRRYSENNIHGFDLNPNLVKATKMNMVMNNDGSGSVFQANSLENPHEWRDELRRTLGISTGTDINKFDVVVTNPPFGTKIPIDDPAILEQFDLAYIWEEKDGTFKKTARLQSSVPPEILFIERCLQLLKAGGRMAIVLPDAILGAPGLKYVRAWILTNTQVLSSIDLHKDTFQPKNGTQTSILLLRKKSPAEMQAEKLSGKLRAYPVFMSLVEHVGHDKRGSVVYKRDEEGNEVIASRREMVKDEENGRVFEREIEVKDKVVDDETTEVAALYSKWKAEKATDFPELNF